ncbi:hypothetical protein [Halodesulfovibrio spirochaetisodalis]|uniref:Uncharacterized protein n=1 Tax=Halodesulfovibrio spirochaetisodalis TaxID=1560234 RepID=A0A1B7XDN4_9BACT|nr:hypothetical protein [Halodesulfovibrio spirochaetisodalis]OBQ52156.1 hypothetical protein SP90_08255 [Halodesulfovibrio spirochaetisodalis]
MNWLLYDPQYLGMRLAGMLVIMTLFAVPSLPLISAISQSIAKSQKKSFYDKFGKQLTRMCLIYGGLAFAALGVATARYLTIDPTVLQGPYQLPLIAAACVSVLAAAVVTMYLMVWKTMRKQKGAHMTLGLVSSVLLFAAVTCLAIVANCLLDPAHPLPAVATPVEVLIALITTANTTSFIFFLAIGFLMGLTLCGAFSQVYLLARRDKDDFGRDYYKFAMPYAAKWAICGAVLQLAASVTLLDVTVFIDIISTNVPADLMQNPAFVAWAFTLGLPVFACILWTFIVLSAAPMRRKVSIYCAAIIVIIANISLLTIGYIGLFMPMALQPAVGQ